MKKTNGLKMSRAFIILGSVFMGISPAQTSASINQFSAILALDSPDHAGKLYNSFRTAQDPYILERVEEINTGSFRIFDTSVFSKKWEELSEEDKRGVVWEALPSREGLDRQHVSGSGQFGQEGFTEIVERIRETDFSGGIVVFDHREEPHGFLKSGVPLSLYGRGDAYSIGKTWSELEGVERGLLLSLAQHKEVLLHQIIEKEEGVVTEAKIFMAPALDAYSEKYLVKDLNGHGYVRIGITDHHRAMDDDLDDIVKAFDAIPLGTWKHFHCRGGKGRTTTGMVLFDILSNHRNSDLSFQDIMIRQYLIGGSNLLSIPTADPKKQWKAKAAYDRIRTIYNFYQRINGQEMKTRQFYEEDAESFQSSSSTTHIIS